MKLTTTNLEQIITALKAAARVEEEGDRRRHARVHLVGRVDIREAPGRAYTALMQDICYAGVRLIQAHAPAPQAAIVFSVTRGRRPALDLRCTVCHVAPAAEGLYSVGCSFDGIEIAAAAAAAG